MKFTTDQRLLIVALVLLGLAGLLYTRSLGMHADTRPPVQRLPIDLRPGVTSTPEFSVAREGKYSLTLYLDRDPAQRDIDCLLGVSIHSNGCAGIVSPLHLSWSLFTDGTLSQQGQSPPRGQGSWSGRRVGNSFGEFSARPGHQYLLRIESRHDASILAPARPEITVSRSAREAKGLFATASLHALVAIATAGLAAVLLMTAAVTHLWRRRRTHWQKTNG